MIGCLREHIAAECVSVLGAAAFANAEVVGQRNNEAARGHMSREAEAPIVLGFRRPQVEVSPADASAGEADQHHGGLDELLGEMDVHGHLEAALTGKRDSAIGTEAVDKPRTVRTTVDSTLTRRAWTVNRRRSRRSAHASPQPLLRMAPAMPDDTNTLVTVYTWLTEEPRTWRTPSAMVFMPWMYASPINPPCVLMGKRPSIAICPPLMKSFASPRPQKPKPSSCMNTIGVNASYNIAV